MAGMGIVAHAVRKLLRTAIAIISLRIGVTSFRERSNCSGAALGGHARLRPWPERLGLRTGWDRALRSHKALGPHAPRRCRSRSSRLVPNSSSLLTQRPRRRSAGPGNTLGTGAADETLRMAKGMLQVSQARVPSSSGVESPSVPDQPPPGTQGPCASWRQRSTDGPTASEPSGLRGAGAPRGAGAECGPAFGPGPSRRRAGSRPRRAAVR